MTREREPIRFYFDYISSNAYIAWTQIHALAEKYGRGVEPVPVLFAGLLNAHGQLGPAEVLVKSWWMCKNNLRKAALLGVPLHAPASHPFNPLLSLRVSLLPMDEVTRTRLIDGLFAGHWARRVDISDPRVVRTIAAEAGLDGDKALDDARQPGVKDRLRLRTDAAIAEGVFGIPTMVADGELFWGYDDFPHLELFLSGKDPLDRRALEGWSRIRPSSTRPGHERGEVTARGRPLKGFHP